MALKKFAKENCHVINVVDADTLPDEAEWFKGTFEEYYTIVDNIGQRIPPVALQRIPVVSLKRYHS